jgi:hypothetical protein
MMSAGAAAFLLRLLLSRDGSFRVASIGAMVVAVIGAAVFLVAAPSNLTSYFKGEIVSVANLFTGNGSPQGGHDGMYTRIQCWKAAFYTIEYYPFGVGPWGLGSVLDKTSGVRLTHEMQFFFDEDVFGLKNAMADLMMETGIVGLGLLTLWLWYGLLIPARKYYAIGTRVGILVAAMYWACASLSVALLVSCELYPCLAMLVIFKFHADAVANACDLTDADPSMLTTEP